MPSRLTLDGVELRFPVYTNSRRSLRNAVVAWGSGGRYARSARFSQSAEGELHFTVLKEIDLDLKEGDSLGLIGNNGAGKSSLLRLMAGVYRPTIGTIRREGRVLTLFDIMLGLDEDATGYENISLASYVRGIPPAEIAGRAEAIAAFADLEAFIHMPIRTYSAGMRTRLAFAISTALEPDILLIDEVFGAGDKDFFERSQERMREIMKSAGILVFASHNNALIRQFCRNSLWLEGGRVRAHGASAEIIEAYQAT